MQRATDTSKILPLRRREVLGLGASAVGMALLPSFGRGAPPQNTLFHTRFAPGDTIPELDGLKLVTIDGARGGHGALGEVAEANQHRQILIPLEDVADRFLELTLRMRSDQGSRCAVWLYPEAGERRNVATLASVPRNWTETTFRFETGSTAKGTLRLVVPSSWGASPGRVWVDEITLTATPVVRAPYEPYEAEDFPVLARDGEGTIWLASLIRDEGSRRIGVWRVRDGQREPVAMLDESSRTGIDRPALAGTDRGCLLVYPVEQANRWQLQPVWIDGSQARKSPLLAAPAACNHLPAVACNGNQAVLVWEANAESRRAIWSCRLTPEGNSQPAVISDPDVPAGNPDVVVLPNGDAFAVWDAFRDEASNLFGAWCRNGRWQREQRLTAAGHLERHPRLARHGEDIWLAWQAQSVPAHAINAGREQRVVVARLGARGLEMPAGMFDHVATNRRFLLRPVPHFDPQGRLWLTARSSMGLHEGWLPQAWCYTGNTWHGPLDLWPDQGRWRPVQMAWDRDGRGVAAVQRDNLPKRWEQQGIHPDWLYDAQLVGPALDPPPAPIRLVPLAMPETNLTPRNRIEVSGAHLPRQQANTGHGPLTLFWGDFHVHSDMSVCLRRTDPPMHDVYANQRDFEKLDFTAITDHGYNFDPPQWAHNGEQVRLHHDPDRFLTFLGEEWTSSRNPPPQPDQPVAAGNTQRYGHRNLIFLNPHHPDFYDAFDGDISPADLWKKLGPTEFICIPHQLADWRGKGRGNPPTDWSFVDEHRQPVAEIFQARQSYEYFGCPRQSPDGAPFAGHYYLQDAWAKGVVIGVIASPDHGGGRGRVGVWARELTREAIFAAVRARHTFGTSGAKIGLLFQQGEHLMGDKVEGRPANPVFQFQATAMHPLQEVVIFRNNEIVHRLEPGAKTVQFEWRDPAPPEADRLWYYARAHGEDNELAWSSPIWFLA